MSMSDVQPATTIDRDPLRMCLSATDAFFDASGHPIGHKIDTKCEQCLFIMSKHDAGERMCFTSRQVFVDDNEHMDTEIFMRQTLQWLRGLEKAGTLSLPREQDGTTRTSLGETETFFFITWRIVDRVTVFGLRSAFKIDGDSCLVFDVFGVQHRVRLDAATVLFADMYKESQRRDA